jgi:sugar lactone lactonase YvrE
MSGFLRSSLATLAALVVLAAGAVAGQKSEPSKKPSQSATEVLTLDPSTNGNPEGIAYDKRSGAFFVGALGNGTIYRGELGSPTLVPYIPGEAGRVAVGMKAKRGKLYVAGGPTGKVLVFDIATKALVATFDTGSGGFLNDLVVTRRGDVWVTDSLRPTLWKISASQVAAGGGTPEALSVAPEIAYQSGFNLNGIVALDGGRRLLVVQSNTGALFRITPEKKDSDGLSIVKVDAEPVFGDGMINDKGRLVVVQGTTAEVVSFRLSENAQRAKVIGRLTDPTFERPSTLARVDGKYVVVNADFTTNTPPFTVSVLPRP